MSKSSKRWLELAMGPVLYVVGILIFKNLMPIKAAMAMGTLLWLVFWWATAPVGLTVTALLPVALNAIFGITDMPGLIANYSSGNIILVFGTCLLTIPWSQNGLDKRVALNVLKIVGPSMKSQVIVWMFACTLFSTLMPNVAICALFCPIAAAMLHAAGIEDLRESPLTVPILCAVGWGAGLGGVGTPIGGAMNVVATGALAQYLGHEVFFIDWVLHLLPYLVITFIVVTALMVFMFARKGERLEGTKEYFSEALKELGPMSFEEKFSGILFVVAVLVAFFRPLYQKALPTFEPAYVFSTFGLVSFFVNSTRTHEPIMTWENASQNMLWGMILLFAGGIAMGYMLNSTGAGAAIGALLTNAKITGGLPALIAFAIMATLLSELTNSTASAAIMVPIVIAWAQSLNMNAIPYVFTTIMAYEEEIILPVSIRSINVGYGLKPEKQMLYGIPFYFARVICAVVIGYVCLNFWPYFATLRG
ncbi:MAG: SLC13 family permease [Eubacteriales bacterium]|nr:SLC13 family permease [Eubacteriales bacterium]